MKEQRALTIIPKLAILDSGNHFSSMYQNGKLGSKKVKTRCCGNLIWAWGSLSQDDIADKEECFKFKKKEKNIDSEIPTRETNQVAN
jgi:hypothetical protein